jgi:hypothetical protein
MGFEDTMSNYQMVVKKYQKRMKLSLLYIENK